MGLGELLAIVIAAIILIAVIAIFAFIFGHSFRQWNHQDLNYELREGNKGTTWVSFAIGIFIILLLLALFRGC